MEPLLGGRLSRLNDHLVERLKERRPTESTASWAFRYAGSWPGVLTVLSGMTYMEHLQDNIRTYSPLEELAPAEYELLEDTAQVMLKYPTVPCTECQYCMPCPYGLDIPGILLHFNKCINEGRMPSSSRDSAYRQARRAFLVGYDRSVPRLRQADHCIGCNQCSLVCPHAAMRHYGRNTMEAQQWKIPPWLFLSMKSSVLFVSSEGSRVIRGSWRKTCASVWDWRIFQRHCGDWTKTKRLPSAILMVIQGPEFPIK